MYNPGEFEGFCPKSCYLRPLSNLFMNVMQLQGPDLPLGTVTGPRAQTARFFSGLHLYLAGRCCDNPQSTRVNPARK